MVKFTAWMTTEQFQQIIHSRIQLTRASTHTDNVILKDWRLIRGRAIFGRPSTVHVVGMKSTSSKRVKTTAGLWLLMALITMENRFQLSPKKTAWSNLFPISSLLSRLLAWLLWQGINTQLGKATWWSVRYASTIWTAWKWRTTRLLSKKRYC